MRQDFSVRPKSILRNNSGQASIEFILTMIFTLGITLLFIALAINTTKGYIAHYVTYMSARTFLVHDSGLKGVGGNLQSARESAKETFDQYNLSSIGISDNGFKVESDTSQSNLFKGVTLTFSQILSPLSVIANGASATFHSEALLGKEPFRTECYQSICTQLTGNSTCSISQLVTVMDNGC